MSHCYWDFVESPPPEISEPFVEIERLKAGKHGLDRENRESFQWSDRNISNIDLVS
jgi:hypothetical protein